MITNDHRELEAVVPSDGPALEFDFPAFRVGVAEYPEGPTGCTVFRFDEPVATAVDRRGGAVGSTGDHDWNHAFCFAGGSSYGLEAAAGVSAELFAEMDYSTAFDRIAEVSGAIIFDFRPRENAIYADKELGRLATREARPGWFPLGARGAGCSARCGRGPEQKGRQPSGQGGSFRRIGPTRIAAFSVVNCLGGIYGRDGQVIRGQLVPGTTDHYHYADELARLRREGAAGKADAGNTTLTLVVTNQRLGRRELIQLARQVHASMARIIQPFHTIFDGDILYAATTAEVENPELDLVALGVEAAETVWDGVLAMVDVLERDD
ncbi:MAG: P1 family peptidase [Planctomycetota bacterium]